MIKCFIDYLYQERQSREGKSPEMIENLNCEICRMKDECEVYNNEQKIPTEQID